MKLCTCGRNIKKLFRPYFRAKSLTFKGLGFFVVFLKKSDLTAASIQKCSYISLPLHINRLPVLVNLK